jgi:23S rRNA pseudouridine2604 synthase
VVTVNREVTQDFVARMSRGVDIGEAVTRPCKVQRLSKFAFRIVLTQGLNRQIRRMCEAQGMWVRSLVRVRIVNLRLGHLKPGQWRKLTPEEVSALLAAPPAPEPKAMARALVAPRGGATSRRRSPRPQSASTSMPPARGARPQPAGRPQPSARPDAVARPLAKRGVAGKPGLAGRRGHPAPTVRDGTRADRGPRGMPPGRPGPKSTRRPGTRPGPRTR